MRKEEKDKNSFININDCLVDNLNLEIEEYKVPNKYESHYALTKQRKNKDIAREAGTDAAAPTIS